jgi:hypothetical protein
VAFDALNSKDIAFQWLLLFICSNLKDEFVKFVGKYELLLNGRSWMLKSAAAMGEANPF